MSVWVSFAICICICTSFVQGSAFCAPFSILSVEKFSAHLDNNISSAFSHFASFRGQVNFAAERAEVLRP